MGFHSMAEDKVVTQRPDSPNGAKALHQLNKQPQNDGPSGKKQHKEPKVIEIQEHQQIHIMEPELGSQIQELQEANQAGGQIQEPQEANQDDGQIQELQEANQDGGKIQEQQEANQDGGQIQEQQEANQDGGQILEQQQYGHMTQPIPDGQAAAQSQPGSQNIQPQSGGLMTEQPICSQEVDQDKHSIRVHSRDSDKKVTLLILVITM